MTPAPGTGPERPAAAPVPQQPAVPAGAVAAGPLLPGQSGEDTDAAWGEYPEPADDRLHRDRPPHWADC
jgi:hypothetical protein